MRKFQRRAIAWRQLFASGLLLGAASTGCPALADGDPGPLTLAEVGRLALVEQPALLSEAAKIRALRDQSVAAGQLPDPQLITGVTQIPVAGSEAFSLRDDDFTALSVGVSQEFPRAAKRRLRAAALEQQATAEKLGLAAVERRVQLQAGLAYLDVVAAAQGARLLDGLAAEAERQQAVAGIASVAGRSNQPQLLAAAVEVEVLADRGRALRQREMAGRSALARWIGPTEADRSVPSELPVLPQPPTLDMLLNQLPAHASLAMSSATARVAATEAQLASAATQPDWRLEMRYDHRLDFPDLVTVLVGVDLPLFTDRRQDRSASAARSRVTADTAQRDDQLREATATLTSAYRQWRAGTDRLERYDSALLPRSRARVQSALAAYQSGQTPLTAVLDARRSLLDAELMRLDLAAEVLRERLQLQYFEPETDR